MKAVKLVEDMLTEDEEVTKKPASENVFSENIEFVIITELEIAWRNTIFDLSLYFDWSTLCPLISSKSA